MLEEKSSHAMLRHLLAKHSSGQGMLAKIFNPILKILLYYQQVLRSVQAYLLSNCPDYTESLTAIITIYDVLLLSFGLDEDDLNDHVEVCG